MSLKHQNSGKWAKSKAIIAKYDEGVMCFEIILIFLLWLHCICIWILFSQVLDSMCRKCYDIAGALCENLFSQERKYVLINPVGNSCVIVGLLLG